MIDKFLKAIANFFSNSKANELQIIVTRGQQKHVIRKLKDFEEFIFQTEDQLDVVPLDQAAKLFKTPDAHLHISINRGEAIRVPPKMILKAHKGYLIPEHLCILTGAGTDSLDPIGKMHIHNYEKCMKLWPEMSFLEIGCGIGRDAFQMLSILNSAGRYIGTDITRDSIVWLQKNIAPNHPNFSFYHFDAKHELYNPLGTNTSFHFTLPANDQSIDRIAVGSVFTHLFEDEILHYMKEIKRVLKPNGLAYATFFIYSEEGVAASRAKSVTPFNLRFEHSYSDDCFVNDPMYKTGAVAYTHDAIVRMINKTGLKLTRPLIRGSWSGLFPDAEDGQDVAILGAI